jgi:predicted Zn-dependent peptidase
MKNQIINLPNETDLSGFYIVHRGSTINEKKGIRGISHLMEHLVCKSIDVFMDDFSRDDIEWNAFTSNDIISFEFQGLEEKLDKYRDKIVELLSKFNITEEEFENEKKIVIEEYKDTFNEQPVAHFYNLSRKYFDNYGPIGDLSDLKNITHEDCKKYFELQFKYPSLIINVSKSNKYENKNIKFAEDSNKYYTYYELKKDNKNFYYQKSNIFKEKTSVIYFSNVLLDDFYHVAFITKMLGFGLQSPLYSELREKRGLVYFIQCDIEKMTDSCGFIYLHTLTSNHNVKELMESLDDILDNPKKYLTKERFDVVMECLKTKLKKEEIERYKHIESYTMPENWNIENYIDEIKYEDILDIYDKYFKNWIKSVDKDEFKK